MLDVCKKSREKNDWWPCLCDFRNALLTLHSVCQRFWRRLTMRTRTMTPEKIMPLLAKASASPGNRDHGLKLSYPCTGDTQRDTRVIQVCWTEPTVACLMTMANIQRKCPEITFIFPRRVSETRGKSFRSGHLLNFFSLLFSCKNSLFAWRWYLSSHWEDIFSLL